MSARLLNPQLEPIMIRTRIALLFVSAFTFASLACSDDTADEGADEVGTDTTGDTSTSDTTGDTTTTDTSSTTDTATDTTTTDTTTTDTGTQDCTSDAAVCLSVVVPADYAGTPVNLLVALYDTLPPMGPPSAVLAQVPMPDIAVGMPLDVQVFDVANQGDYFVYVALFMEGGGMFQPVVDIDYVGSTAAAVTVGGAGVDVGPIDLALYAAP